MEEKVFMDKIRAYNPYADINLISKAFNLAKNAHSNQKRDDGEEFFDHPLQVALILMESKAGSATICAALLHDVVEDSKIQLKKIREEFGDEIATIVDGLTKIEKVNFDTKEDYTAENLRKILLATTKDIRIMFIKLADRLHNMRTLYSFKKSKQRRIAQQTMDIYAPIAHKLGMGSIKGELEDLSLRYLEPEIYQILKNKINEKRAEREKKTEEIIRIIEDDLIRRNLKAQVTGRAKYFYSIYKKMKQKTLDLDEIYDLIAIRITVKTIPDCYTALGAVHELWQPLPRRFKDYIANPKLNGYQSLHTVLKGPYEKRIEVQIRTEEMHLFAEDGIAAHWRYHGTERDKKFDKKISWLKQLLEWRSNSDDAKEFIDTLKLDLFENEIVVFTPKGDPITLPEGSTPIDFAFEVHTNLGEKCSKALVNGKIVPLNHELLPGDIVEVITQKNAQPSRSWISFVKTNKAKSKIKSMLNITVEMDTKAAQKGDQGTKTYADEIEAIDQKPYTIKISKCCSPSYGDDIGGYLTKDKKLTIHKKGCPNIHALESTKEIAVRWKEDRNRNLTRIRVTVQDALGVLIEILNFFVNRSFNVININTKQSKERTLNITLEMLDADEKSINEAVRDLRHNKLVLNVAVIKYNNI